MKFTLLHVGEMGALDGPTLVYVPGLGGTTPYFEKHLGLLLETHRVLFADPLGLGDSPESWVRHSIDRHSIARCSMRP